MKPRRGPRIQTFSVFQVLSTVELLESILFHVHSPYSSDIMTCRLINKRFKDVIDSSLVIQRTLFLAPERSPTTPNIPDFNRKLYNLETDYQILNTSTTHFRVLFISLCTSHPRDAYRHLGSNKHVAIELRNIGQALGSPKVVWTSAMLSRPSVAVDVFIRDLTRNQEVRRTVQADTLGEAIDRFAASARVELMQTGFWNKERIM